MSENKVLDKEINSILSRAHYLATQMIYQANVRKDKNKGDPKVGGHVSASSSALHILGALHLFVKKGWDFMCNKPHASPTDHAFNYLLDLFFKSDGTKFNEEEKNRAMMNLRAFPTEDSPHVFQSYHSAFDPDSHNFLPSGTVGIPPVHSGYLALAYRFARTHGYKVLDSHFWCVMGDSEFREGSLFEATPDFAEREIGQLTWILDYNRQSLDGHRITNQKIMGGTDSERIERTMTANGWEVIQVRHGRKRQALFKQKGGGEFRKFLERELSDYALQALLLIREPKQLKKEMGRKYPSLKDFLKRVSQEDLYESMRDLGGHDLKVLIKAFEQSKENSRKPTLVIAHTLKGWGLEMEALQGNHSLLPGKKEMEELREKQSLDKNTLFSGFKPDSGEDRFLKERGREIEREMKQQFELKKQNQLFFQEQMAKGGGVPQSFNINLKLASYPHTQWFLGQCTAKLTRIANTKENEVKKPLTEEEKRWLIAAQMLTTMAPDVGTSTNLNPTMDGKIFSSPVTEDLETEYGVKDPRVPDLIPNEENSDRFVRFEITEANTMSCMGSYGSMRDILGIPILPLMTVYDFFLKRALDQLFYNLYWGSSFILVGTPSGVTLSPEGAQHGWKSDIQIPNQIIWEPTFCQEMDWILSESIRRHLVNDNKGRSGVIIRGVTRGIDQKLLLKHLKRQLKYKKNQIPLSLNKYPLNGYTDESTVEALPQGEIMKILRSDVLKGAYSLVDYRGYADYVPGDNVVNIFSMGTLVTEALSAGEKLLEKGIYANVIVVTSPDLFVGHLARENDYFHLREGLGMGDDLLKVPCVSVHDGEPGILDNIGSLLGVRQESLAVRKHSKCGRPVDVYGYHGIDSKAVVSACHKVLVEEAGK